MAVARVVQSAVMVVLLSLYCNGNFYPSLLWTPENPKFTSSNGHFQMRVLQTYRMHLICPNIATIISRTNTSLRMDQLYENVWIVDQGSFDTCRVDTSNSNNKKLMSCDTPLKLKHHTLVFQPFSAEIADTVFEKGQSYYFIATSNGSQTSLGSTKNGHCNTGMKMEVYVCWDEKDCEAPETTPAPTIYEETKPTSSKNIQEFPTDDGVRSSGGSTASEKPKTSAPDGPDAPNVAERVDPNPSGNDNDSRLSTWHILVGVLAVLLAGCIVTIFMLLHNKHKAKKDQEEGALESMNVGTPGTGVVTYEASKHTPSSPYNALVKS